jgi:hypothetical protein
MHHPDPADSSLVNPVTTLPPFPAPPTSALAHRRLSVVVTNRNYERFLSEAIDSVLDQRGPPVELIVVDDGSTDGSRAVLAGYGGRCRAVLQERGGQKAAFNAGLAAATGDVVLFLDADDTLDRGVAEAVVCAFETHPHAVRVIFRLRVVDERGRPTGACVPACGRPLPDGDVRASVLRFPDDIPWPPTSGNAFATWALRRVMPLPVDGEPTGADSLLHPVIPLLGPIVALDRIGGAYRLHPGNAHLRDRLDIDRSRAMVRRARQVHPRADALARELGYGGAAPRSVTIAAHRLISLRLGGPGHPIAGDSRRRALGAGVRASLGRSDVSALRRAAFVAWLLAVASAPPRVVRALAETALQPVRAKPVLRLLGAR